MATARKSTKEVTTTETVYTLELSEAEARNLKEYLHQTPNAWAVPILDALRNPQGAPSLAPLKEGDRVRVIGYYRESRSKDVVPLGAYSVASGLVDDDGEFKVYDNADNDYPYYLPADGEGTVWERV